MKKHLNNITIIYLVGDDFGVEFETFGNIEFAERGTQLAHHFRLGPHVSAAVVSSCVGIMKWSTRLRYANWFTIENLQCFRGVD